MRKDRGIALITVLILFILILAVGIILLNIVNKATRTGYSAVKYETAMEAASSGVNAGMINILNNIRRGTNPEGEFVITLGDFKVHVKIEKILTARAKGTSVEFGGGYQGLGKGEGQVFSYFRIISRARGKTGELFTIETNYKQIMKAF